MATAAFGNIIVQVDKKINEKEDTVYYHARLFTGPNAPKLCAFQYEDGHFILKSGTLAEREHDLSIHCIQALELALAFP